MADVIEKFDFDDKPGLDKLKNLGATAESVGEKAQQMGNDIQEAVDKSTKKSGDLDAAFGKIGKTVGSVASIAAKVAGAATLAFGAATAGAIALASHNDVVKKQQEGLYKQWDELRELLGVKLAPILYGLQTVFSDLLRSATKGTKELGTSFAVDVGASIIAASKASGAFFNNIKVAVQLNINELKKLGNIVKTVLSARNPQARDTLRAEMEQLEQNTIDLSKEVQNVGEVYKKTKDDAIKTLSAIDFTTKRATKEQIAAIMKLREEYAKFNAELDSRLNKSRIAAKEGLAAIDEERKQALENIDLFEAQGRALAERLKVQFEGEEKINELRKNVEIDFQQKRKDLIDKTNKEIAKESRALFKEAFGVYFEDLEALGKKANKAVTDDVLKVARKQNDEIQKNLKKISKEEANKGIFDDFKNQLLGSLGLTSDEAGLILGVTGDVLQQAGELFTANIDRRIADNDRLLESIRERTQVAQAELNKELELQKQGRENNVKSKQEELSKLRAEEDRAQKEREKLEKKQRRAQLIADTIQQISSLTTAAADVFKANAKIPIVGVILGIAAVAALFAAFSAAKNKAQSAASKDRAYKGGSLKGRVRKEGGFVNWMNGRTDVPGRGEGHAVENSNLVLGGREMVISEGPANQQTDNFWDNMNSGKYNGVNLESTLDDHLFSPKTINRNFEKRQVKIVKMRESRKAQEYITKGEMQTIMKKHSSDIITYLENKPEHLVIKEDSDKIAILKRSGKDIKLEEAKSTVAKWRAS